MEILNARVAELGARALKGLMESSIVPTATINFGASIPGTDSIYCVNVNEKVSQALMKK